MKSDWGFTFIGLLLVLAIILFLFYKAINFYFKKPLTINKETEEALFEQDIDTINYKSILDSTKEKIQDIQTQRMKQLENIR